MTKYARRDAKDYAREHLRGIWAAALTPFRPDDVAPDGSPSTRPASRATCATGPARSASTACSSAASRASSSPCRWPSASAASRSPSRPRPGRAGTIMSCSDQNMDVVIDLARHAQAVGADFIVVHAPVLHFLHDRDDTLFEYYRAISEQVDIGIAMWSHPDSGYLMSPELCARIAELPNIVAIKYSVPREMYVQLTHLAGDTLIVSTASEDEWFDNIVELNWQVYLCSNPPFLFQTAADRRMRDYTDLAMRGDIARARAVRDSLDPVRAALQGAAARAASRTRTRNTGRNCSARSAARCAARCSQLTEAEKAATRARVRRMRPRASTPRGSGVNRRPCPSKPCASRSTSAMDRRARASAQAAGRQQAGVRGSRHGRPGRRRPEPARRFPRRSGRGVLLPAQGRHDPEGRRGRQDPRRAHPRGRHLHAAAACAPFAAAPDAGLGRPRGRKRARRGR